MEEKSAADIADERRLQDRIAKIVKRPRPKPVALPSGAVLIAGRRAGDRSGFANERRQADRRRAGAGASP